MTDREMEIYDILVELEVCTAEELNLVKNIKGGTWTEIYDAICYVRTGYTNYEQFEREEIFQLGED